MLPGVVWDPSPLMQMLPGGLPDPVLAATAAIPVEAGVAFVPVPGPPGTPGSAAATLPWASITDRPDLVTEDEVTPAVDLVLVFENVLA